MCRTRSWRLSEHFRYTLYSKHFALIQIIHQLFATVSPVYYLTFMYSSTCFGRPHVHHQELNNCSSSLWFYRWSVVVAVLLIVVGPCLLFLCRLRLSYIPTDKNRICTRQLQTAGQPARPRPTALLPPRSNGKTRDCYCSCWAPDDGREDARNTLSCTQTPSNKLEKLLHLVGDLFEFMMMHGLANFKLRFKYSIFLVPSFLNTFEVGHNNITNTTDEPTSCPLVVPISVQFVAK